jgi:hypothetical protein
MLHGIWASLVVMGVMGVMGVMVGGRPIPEGRGATPTPTITITITSRCPNEVFFCEISEESVACSGGFALLPCSGELQWVGTTAGLRVVEVL